jgi:hypothetical protein
MADAIEVIVNGMPVTLDAHASVAVALAIAGAACRTSVQGEARGPLCAMGICFECRAMINGVPHRRTCQIDCEHGMDIRTQ